jgi:hypothetical protein
MSESKVLTKEYIQENSSTDEGVDFIKDYLINARISFGLMNVLSYLGNEARVLSRVLSENEAQDICNILLYCLKKTPHDQILEYIKSCEDDEKSRKVFEPETFGSA